MKLNQKWFLVLLALILALSLAACSSDNQSNQSAPPAAPSEGNEQAPKEEEPQQPVEIHLGVGFATEEPLWYMEVADPSIVPNRDKSYTLKMTKFRANADRLNAYQAGQIVGGSIGSVALMFADAQGVPIRAVATIANDTPGKGYNHPFMALKSSGLNSVADLKDKIIGIPDFKSPTDMWARAAVRTAGLDPDKDVKFAVVAIQAMIESIKSGKIDVGMLPQPFGTIAQQSGEFQEVFNSKTGLNYDEDFLVLFMQPEFIENNKEVVKDFLSDYASAMKHYINNDKQIRQVLIDEGIVEADPQLYVNMVDSNHTESGKLNKENLKKTMDILLEEKWIDNPVDLDKLVDNSLLPN